MKQHYSETLKMESIYLLSGCHFAVLQRTIFLEDEDKTSKQPFRTHFIVDYLDEIGRARKAKEFLNYVSLHDYEQTLAGGYVENLGNKTVEEFEDFAVSKIPISRASPFDFDDDIVITPNFFSKRISELLVFT